MILPISYGPFLLAENLKYLKFSRHLPNSFTHNFLQNVKSFHCDNGSEYNNELFRKYCTDHGLVFLFLLSPHILTNWEKQNTK